MSTPDIISKSVNKAKSTITNKTNKNIDPSNPLANIVDSEWLKSTFIIKDSDIVAGDEYSKWIKKNRYFSTADMKFTSTVPGMSLAVNPKPQFTRYCDVRSKGKLQNRPDVNVGETTGYSQGLGMGRYYSEAIDDSQQRIYLRFGVPKYMPLLIWITKAFDIDKVILQNRGVITSTFITAVGVVAKFFAIASAPILAIGMGIFSVVTQNTRFYSVKDTMYIYWSTVENILNQMVARRTMMPHVLQDYSYKLDNPMMKEQKITPTFVEALNSLIPDIIDKETGRISVFTIALRSQAAFNQMLKKDLDDNMTKDLSTDFTGYQLTGENSHNTYFTNRKGEPSSFSKWIFNTAHKLLMSDNKSQDANTKVKDGDPTTSSLVDYDELYTDPVTGNPISLNLDSNDPKDSVEGKLQDNAKAKKSTYDKYKEYMLAELSEGAMFAIFNVDSTGSVGESFSNSHGSNPIESTFNALSSKSRNLGNLLSSATDIPVVGDVLKLAADAGSKFLSSSTFGIANPLLALAYGVNVTMPKIWESSAASLPRASYKFKLISPYGNAYSQLFNIYLPLAMVLAGSLPRGTGCSTYTSPFVCQLFDRGRVNISLGMIESVSITRGTSNLPFSRNGHANAIDVDISIANLDEIINVDVNSSGVISKFIDAFSPVFSDTPMTSYLNTVTGVDVFTQIYRVPMLRLKLAERMMVIKSITNPDPAALAAFTVNKLPMEGLAKLLIGNNQAAIQNLTNL